MSDIAKKLEDARQNLLDLTMHNPLLNIKKTKRTIKVEDRVPNDIYDILVLQGKKMEFCTKPELQQNISEVVRDDRKLNNESPVPFENTEQHLDDPTLSDIRTPIPCVDTFLYITSEHDTLQKRLLYVYQQSQSVLEEQGYTVLYLAMGFLEWTEDSNTKIRRAPLILIPVELERNKVGASFKLHWTGEDIISNISLRAKLINEYSLPIPLFERLDDTDGVEQFFHTLKAKYLEHGIQIPGWNLPYDKTGIDTYFQSVIDAVSTMPNWRIVPEIYLDFFRFKKYIMHQDLNPKIWPDGRSTANHPLIKAIFDPQVTQYSKGFSEDDVDTELKSRDVYHVMDADPSQIAVIEDVKAGQNLVVEGPPGTGKSQTITNIIAELLAAGKTVLFVSDKMAALEVVKDRLDMVGLGDFCLELHSRKAKKKEVLRELERTINRSPSNLSYSEEDFDSLDALKHKLNDYATALREPIGVIGRTPFDLFGIKENVLRHFSSIEGSMPRIVLSNVEKCNQTDWNTAVSSLTTLAGILPSVKPISKHPWRGSAPSTVLASDESEILKIINDCEKSIKYLEIAINHLTQLSGTTQPSNLNELKLIIDAAKVVAESKPIDKEVLLNENWNKSNDISTNLITEIETYKKQRYKILPIFALESLEQDIEIMLKEYKELSAKFIPFRIFDSRYRYLKREIFSLYNDSSPKSYEKLTSDLKILIDCIKMRENIREANQDGLALFGTYWLEEKSDPQTLRSFTKWIILFKQQLMNKVLLDQAVDIVCTGISVDEIEKAIDEVLRSKEHFTEIRNQLISRINGNYEIIFGLQADDVPFLAFKSQFELWKTSLSKLQHWSQFTVRHNACMNTIGYPIVELIDSDLIEPDDIVPTFEGNLADEMLHYAFNERSALAEFIGEEHECEINNFIEFDRKIISQNRQRLAQQLYQRRPHLVCNPSKYAGSDILLSEFNRKRGHMSIRKLLINTGPLIQKIKPCFMMSPLSIAQFLDPHSINFDVVVFDEASQVKPEDALGALLRGNQAIVIGDTRQLPPTSFFDYSVESWEDEDELTAPIADIESILQMCKRSFLTKTLRWHYRSRHESLIAVSNHEFYDNQLVIYPSPVVNPDHLGLKLVHSPNAIYDPGISSVNRIEAKIVAEAAIEHYRTNPDKSLGIGTFNEKQQQAILEEVEQQLNECPEMQEFFRDTQDGHFFVKNIETIQGDERDVIFVSIGFGFDESGRLNLNFGALNHDGGERRLNVLMTRARELCLIFSNFKAKDLKLKTDAPFGMRALKTFLDFAETKNLQTIEDSTENIIPTFEDSVYETLLNQGYDIQKQVGCAGYKIDLAVVDPNSPNSYLLGIECDGTKYYSSHVARERNRLCQQVLEGLGWNIYRVWSTDWYRNHEESECRLLESIKQAKYTRV